MLLSLSFLSLGLAGLVQSAVIHHRSTPHITCYPAIVNDGTLYYGSTSSPSYVNKIGVVDASGKAPLLAKYPSANVKNSLKVNVMPCSSSYLNYSVPMGCTTAHAPVLLYAADGSGDCLQLQSTSSTNVLIVKAACSTVDGSVQLNQFWTQTAEGSYYPAAHKQPATSWDLQISEKSGTAVYANPHVCPSGKICQASTHIAFYIK